MSDKQSDASKNYHGRSGPEHPSDCACPYHVERRLNERVRKLEAEVERLTGSPSALRAAHAKLDLIRQLALVSDQIRRTPLSLGILEALGDVKT